MIVVRYRGGLGNQMFQYAFQYALQKRFPDCEIKADITHYSKFHEHNGFEITRYFGLDVNQAVNAEIRKLSPYLVVPSFFCRLPECVRNRVLYRYEKKYYVYKTKKNKGRYYKQDFHCSYEPQVFELLKSGSWYADGLWQDVRYFEEYKQELKEAFRFQNASRYSQDDLKMLEWIKARETVGVHVRRGDFVHTASKFDVCSKEYYSYAIEQIRKMKGNVEFVFFSDDIEYVKKEFAYLGSFQTVTHDVSNSIIDMEMLGACKHKILSNSTFAYWGAWLSDETDGIVMAPKWSIMKKNARFELSAPSDWIKIENGVRFDES